MYNPRAVLSRRRGSSNHRFSGIDDLDFFILLSSNVGILGNASQANYAAGGTYEDALARIRHRLCYILAQVGLINVAVRFQSVLLIHKTVQRLLPLHFPFPLFCA
jgi:hypothetical protein